MALPSARTVRLLAILAVVPTVVMAGLSLTTQKSQKLLAHGPLITGHSDVACIECHVSSSGGLRQQIQAELRYAMGLRETSVDFGYQAVSSDACLTCHTRPNERHPIYRFQEPRFVAALEIVDARSCLGCHSEHEKRVVDASLEVCQACHSDIKVRNDPIDVSHAQLAQDKAWDTCLGCHDFHGNHAFKAPLTMQDRIPSDAIRAYFEDGDDPFGTEKIFEARSE